jgi:hypothetical protein
MKYSIRNEEQPIPILDKNLPSIQDLVLQDIEERKRIGIERYGDSVRPFNGRDPLIDLYQELMDSVIYIRWILYEKYGE